MKKIFTLISMAFMAMSVNAQDVYNAIVDGKLAQEFAAVAGEDGGVANNAADGKSIVTILRKIRIVEPVVTDVRTNQILTLYFCEQTNSCIAKVIVTFVTKITQTGIQLNKLCIDCSNIRCCCSRILACSS